MTLYLLFMTYISCIIFITKMWWGKKHIKVHSKYSEKSLLHNYYITILNLTDQNICSLIILFCGRVSLDMMSVQGHTGPAWEQKMSKAFWRGRDSRKERLELVKLARANPAVLDAALTNFFFFKHDESLYGPLVKHVSFFDFFKVWELHTTLINIAFFFSCSVIFNVGNLYVSLLTV